ncbi:UDP-N-acetylglucosamine--LPS N-acetylglucosamine transferase [Euzebya tangerina]|uniref:UDP-N-acetylglucosamine--LPS N-acetylglucosamine transferase n=1 Tax=Euzebya tangerina TaxID=591198 RepID=UPI000E322313
MVSDVPVADAGAVPLTDKTILLVGSSGGHLTQLRALEPWLAQHNPLWVTFDKPDARAVLADDHVIHGYHPTTRNIPNLIRNTRLAWRILSGQRVDAIVSSGAGLALPFFILGRLRGIPTFFIEVYDRIDSASLTGRLCRPLSTAVFLQWEEQRAFYPDGIVIGRLL